MTVLVVGVRCKSCVLMSTPLLMAFSRASHFVTVTVTGIEASVEFMDLDATELMDVDETELMDMDATELMVTMPVLVIGIVPPVEFQRV